MSCSSSDRCRSIPILSATLVSLGLAVLSACTDPVAPVAPTLSVLVNTSGVDHDGDGYYVSIPTSNRPVATTGEVKFEGLRPGSLDVILGGVAFNCTVTSPNPQRVTLAQPSERVIFDVVCEHTPQIAFMSDASLSVQIWAMRPDGTGRRQITNSIGTNTNPVWSPDGSRIAFISTRDGNPEIYVMNADGGSVRRLTNDPRTENPPIWSPDGSKLAFTRVPIYPARYVVYVMNSDGSNVIDVSQDASYDNVAPSWSPDGTRLVYVTTVFTSQRGPQHELRIVNSDGTGRRIVQPRPDSWPVEYGSPFWSPDGTRIAFVERSTWISTVNVDGSEYSMLGGYFYPTLDGWSRDSKDLLLETEGDILTVTLGTGNLRNLTNDGYSHFDYSASWSPDGTKILYNRSDGLFVMNRDGTGTRNLTSDGFLAAQADWRP